MVQIQLSCVEHSLSTLPLSLSGPEALCGFTLLRMEVTSYSSMVRARDGLEFDGVQGVEVLLQLLSKRLKKLLSCSAKEGGSRQSVTAGLGALPIMMFNPCILCITRN